MAFLCLEAELGEDFLLHFQQDHFYKKNLLHAALEIRLKSHISVILTRHIFERDLKFPIIHLPIHPAIHREPGKLPSVFIHMIIFTVAISDKSFDMQINGNISWRVNRYHYGLVRLFWVHYMTFSFENSFGKDDHTLDQSVIRGGQGHLHMRLENDMPN